MGVTQAGVPAGVVEGLQSLSRSGGCWSILSCSLGGTEPLVKVMFLAAEIRTGLTGGRSQVDSAPRLRIAPELIERLLTSVAPDEALQQLDAWWCARAGRSAEQPSFGLSPAEFRIHLYLIYTGEVGNGGHEQFFLNPTGSHAEAVATALSELGLEKLAAIYAQARSVFPGASVPTEAMEREALAESLSDAALTLWQALDQQVYALGRETSAAVLEYARRHRDELLALESAAGDPTRA